MKPGWVRGFQKSSCGILFFHSRQPTFPNENTANHRPIVGEQLVGAKEGFRSLGSLPRGTRRERNESSMIHPRTSPVDANPRDSMCEQGPLTCEEYTYLGCEEPQPATWPEDRLVLTSGLPDGTDRAHSPPQQGSYALSIRSRSCLTRRA